MNVLHINTSAEGGAAKAVQRIHAGLLKEGVDSKILVLYQSEVDVPGIAFFLDYPTKGLSRLVRSVRYRIHTKISPFRRVSSPLTVFKVESHPLIGWADIICLHWVADFINYPSFFSNVAVLSKPIIWRPPDLYPLRGVVHYDDDLSSSTLRLEEKAIEIKRKALSNHQNLTFVASSRWMLDQINSSVISKNLPTELVHNALDITNFSGEPISTKSARKSLSWESDGRLVLFIANNLSNPTKGLGSLLRTMKEKKELDFRLVLVGSNLDEKEIEGLDTVYLGPVKSEEKLRLIYYAVDLYVTCSREEAFGQTVLEAISCGKPVVAFGVGGIRDMVIHKQNGLLAEKGDINGLVDNIEMLLSKPETLRSFGQSSRSLALSQFTQELQIAKYKQLFQKSLPT